MISMLLLTVPLHWVGRGGATPAPFTALWNSHWPHDCPTTKPPFGGKEPSIDLASFGIVTNAAAAFNGRAVATLYGGAENETGLCPYLADAAGKIDSLAWNTSGAQFANGGLPQRVNMTRHLALWGKQVERQFPDPNFSGVVGLDWEHWFPLWDMNANMDPNMVGYNEASLADVRHRFPELGLAAATTKAKEEFETAALQLMVQTVKTASKLRPKGLFGFFGYPGCFSGPPWICFRPPLSSDPCPVECTCSGPDGPPFNGTPFNLSAAALCPTQHQAYNDRLQPLYEAVTALLPGIYMETFDAIYNRANTDAELAETRRVAAKMTVPPATYAYTWYEYGWAAPMRVPGVTPPFVLNNSDMITSYERTAEQGVTGTVMWGSSNLLASRTGGASMDVAGGTNLPECNPQLAEYVRGRLGPFVRAVVANASACSKTLCSGHGRCVRLPGDAPTSCDCFEGWDGTTCTGRRAPSE
jgi:hyaluronoglucosaminidase